MFILYDYTCACFPTDTSTDVPHQKNVIDTVILIHLKSQQFSRLLEGMVFVWSPINILIHRQCNSSAGLKLVSYSSKSNFILMWQTSWFLVNINTKMLIKFDYHLQLCSHWTAQWLPYSQLHIHWNRPILCKYLIILHSIRIILCYPHELIKFGYLYKKMGIERCLAELLYYLMSARVNLQHDGWQTVYFFSQLNRPNAIIWCWKFQI